MKRKTCHLRKRVFIVRKIICSVTLVNSLRGHGLYKDNGMYIEEHCITSRTKGSLPATNISNIKI